MFGWFKRKIRYGLVAAVGLVVVLAGCSDSGSSGGTEALVNQARQFLAEGKTRHALIKLKESVQDDPENGAARLLLATIYLRQGEASNAEIEIKKAIKLGVEREYWVPILGRSLLLQSRFDAVINDFKEETQDNNKVKAEIALMKGDAYIAKKQLEKAREQYSQALLYEPVMLGPVFGMARVSIGHENYVLALEYLDKVLSQDANHLAAIIKKGDVLLRGGNREQALQLYDRAVKAQPGSFQALMKRAHVLIGIGRAEEAQQDVQAVLKLYPAAPLAHYLNARVYFSLGDIDKARDALQEVFSVQGDYQAAQLLNGVVAIATGRYRLAEQSLLRQLSVEANHLLSEKLLSLVNIHLGDAEKVIARLSKQSKTIRLDREALAIAGVAALRVGDVKRGESALKSSFALWASMQVDGQDSGLRDNSQSLAGIEGLDVGGLLQEKKIIKQFFSKVMNDEVANLLKDTKPSGSAFYHAGLIRMVLGETDIAREHINEALSRGFDQIEARIALAQIESQKKQWVEAKKLLVLVLEKEPKNVSALITMIRVHEKMGDKAQALQWLKQAWQRDPDSLVIGLALFKHYLKDKKPALADEVVKALLSRHADNLKLTETVAKLYANGGYPLQAVALLQEKVRKDKDSIKLPNVLLLADMTARQGKLAESDTLYQQVLSHDANNRYALLGLIRLRIKEKNYDKASKFAQQLLESEPDLPLGYQVQASIATLQQQYPQAVKLYIAAIQKGESEQLLMAYVNVLMKNNNQDQAVLESRNWLFKHPKHHRVRFLLAGIYQQLNRIDKSIEEYLLLKNSQAFRMVALNNLIWLFLDGGDPRLEDYVEKLVQMKPKAPEIMDTIGWAYLQGGKKEKAGEYLLSAAERLKANPSVQYHLAVYYKAVDEIPKARKLLGAIVNNDKAFAEKIDAKKLLSTL